MQQPDRKLIAAFATALTLGLGVFSVATAHEGHDHGASHGGTLAKTPNYHFEVVFSKDGVKVYPLTADHKPVDGTGLSATATFYHPSTPKPWFSRPLRAAAPGPGQASASLDCAIDLSKVPAQGVRVAFEVAGLPSPAEPKVSFTVPFAPAAGGEITVTKATAADQKAINAQKVCKVSHEALGSMGVPLKATRGDKSILVCCQGCIKEIKADPDKFFGPLASAPAAKGEHKH